MTAWVDGGCSPSSGRPSMCSTRGSARARACSRPCGPTPGTPSAWPATSTVPRPVPRPWASKSRHTTSCDRRPGHRRREHRRQPRPGRAADGDPWPARPFAPWPLSSLDQPTVVVTAHALRPFPAMYEQGIRAVTVPWRRELPDVKAVSYLLATMARRRARALGPTRRCCATRATTSSRVRAATCSSSRGDACGPHRWARGCSRG